MDDWDWELLQETQNPETELKTNEELHKKTVSPSTTTPPPSSSSSSVCDDCAVIRSDYFSLESQHNSQEEEQVEEVESDNPSWVDPTNITVSTRRERISSCSNSDSSEPSDSRNLLLLIDPHSDCGVENSNGSDAVEWPINVDGAAAAAEEEVVVEESGNDEGRGESEAKRVVWWKVPLEVVRYCVLRVSPVWSLSMAAAAVMGFVILRRRYLYKMKRKTQGLQLKVTVDDKKVSQFMSRAARLNEAFSVVKRVPIIRPALPAPGLAPWPMVSLR